MLINNIKRFLASSACLRDDDDVLILYDETTDKISALIESLIIENFNVSSCRSIESTLSDTHGREPCPSIALEMTLATIIICLTNKSLAHTDARKQAATNGARFLSMPDTSPKSLQRSAFRANFLEYISPCRDFARCLSEGRTLRVTSSSGTDISFDIESRIANPAPGCVQLPGDLGSPPDIEVNIAPLETRSNGIAVVDKSITYGSLNDTLPILFEFSEGSLISLSGSENLQSFKQILFNHSHRRIIGEVGFGMNPYAIADGTSMLEDEGAYGTFHLGIGSNHTIGGSNRSDMHIDLICTYDHVFIDNIEVSVPLVVASV